MAFITEFALTVPGWEKTYLFKNKEYPIVMLRLGFITFIKFNGAATMLFKQFLDRGANIDVLMKDRIPELAEWKRETEKAIKQEVHDRYDETIKRYVSKLEEERDSRRKAQGQAAELLTMIKTLVSFKDQP